MPLFNPDNPLDLYSTNELLKEVRNRFDGFVFFARRRPKVPRPGAPDEVVFDYDIPYEQVKELCTEGVNLIKQEEGHYGR